MQPKPWGVLVGVRPSKQIHRLIDRGFSRNEALEFMQREFGLQEEKFALLWQICLREKPVLEESSNPQLFSIYVGIPFCPTRCFYCSFPSHSLAELGKLRTPFVETLLQEIHATGLLTESLGMKPYTVYLGGGTPTCLLPGELERIITALKEAFPGSWREFTVEAGRPDTITVEQISLLSNLGVDRISVNPQSMHDQTLQAIGRCHTVDDIEEAVSLVRRYGIRTLNMDLIIGLPGENTALFSESMQKVLALAPENITLHVFSPKRASRYRREPEKYSLPPAEEAAKMHKTALKLLKQHHYEPYYLYRQRNILAGLENIGFAQPGRECLYNIVMIEERHHILGLGGGATSKIINPDLTLTNIATPKDVRMYMQRMPELLTRREKSLRRTKELAG